jgi:TPR repeat protein
MKRIEENNDPAAMFQMGRKRYIEGDYETALDFFTKAAELGNAGAHHNLSVMYRKGQRVEKDEKKEVYHLEEAAIGGHPGARHNLGIIEANNGRYERAKKHWIIAANLGYHDSLNVLRQLYANGDASKEDYTNALRAYQASLEATKSAEREVADAYFKALDAARLNN